MKIFLGKVRSNALTRRGPSTGSDHCSPRAAELLAGYDIVADTAEEAVTALDQVPAPRPLTVSGSVGYDQMSLADESAEVTVPLTGGQFYLSMAPYRTRPTKLREASAAVKRLVKS